MSKNSKKRRIFHTFLVINKILLNEKLISIKIDVKLTGKILIIDFIGRKEILENERSKMQEIYTKNNTK